MPTTGNGFDPLAQYARLSERVENQGKDIVDLRSNMNTGFQTLNSSINALSNELRSNSKTQWPVIWSAIGVSFAVLGGIGTMAYYPIREAQAQLKMEIRDLSTDASGAITALAEKAVTQKELEWRTARAAEDRQRTEASMRELRGEQVPRQEHERIWAGYDERVANIQRQIDEVKQAQGSVYGQRDIILDLRERLDRIERQRLGGG
ncbi:hypothetical protein [Pseudorhizobium flavum]|uniref:hypothetical protein n=1 Tax=Pseudorhizobium flavum TaxID=1335061 RepID=UPI00248FA538|nr:hypothetical protein [Pseudorhizobium flavum]